MYTIGAFIIISAMIKLKSKLGFKFFEVTLNMKKYAVLTFDEPEFEPSYVDTPNEGKGGFCRLFFTGKLKFSDISFKVYKHRNFVKASIYLFFQFFYAIKSMFMKTETIFDFLSKYNIKGTFFGVFNLIDERKDRQEYLNIFKSILSEGHELGLHGYKHLPLTSSDLERSTKLARELLNVELNTYSSPWGDDRDETVRLLKENNFKGFRVWSMDESQESNLVRLKYRNNLKDCSLNEEYIILNIHGPDMYPVGKKNILKMIATLKSNGYEFVTFRSLCNTELDYK